jgi:hypothetical protein
MSLPRWGQDVEFLISEYLQHGQDGCADPLNPEFHKEFSSRIHSGEL